MALQSLLYWTVDGLGSAGARKLVTVGLRVELAVSLRLQTEARIAWATRPAHATHKRAQVQLVSMNKPGCLRFRS